MLDEPEAALSATRQLSLLVRMHDLLAEHPRTQFVIATHSPILLAFPGAQIVSFDAAALREIAYRETDAFTVTRRFLMDPDGMLARLFQPEEHPGWRRFTAPPVRFACAPSGRDSRKRRRFIAAVSHANHRATRPR